MARVARGDSSKNSLSEQCLDVENTTRIIVDHLRGFIFSVEVNTSSQNAPLASEREAKQRHFTSESFISLYDRLFRLCYSGHIRESCQIYVREMSAYLKERIARPIFDSFSLHASSLSCRTDSRRTDASPALAMTVAKALNAWSERYRTFKLVSAGFADSFMYLNRYLSSTPEAGALRKEFGFQSRDPLRHKSMSLYRNIAFESNKEAASRCVVYLMKVLRHDEVMNVPERDRDLDPRSAAALLASSVRPFYELFGTQASKSRHSSPRAFCGQRRLDYKIVKINLQTSACKYYKAHVEHWMQSLGKEGYVDLVERAMRFEESASAACLLRSSIPAMKNTCSGALLCAARPAAFLIGRSSVDQLLKQPNIALLRRIVDLYDRCGNRGCFVEAIKALESHVGEVLQQGIERAGKSSECRFLAAALKQFEGLLKNAFGGHAGFTAAVRRAFATALNRSDNATSERLAHAAHQVLLRSKVSANSDDAILLEQLPGLYSLLAEKDVFDVAYQNRLQIRLLNRQVASESAERALIARLREIAGYQWAKNLSGMLEDCKLSRALGEEFSRSSTPPSIPTNPVVGRYGNWSVASRGSGPALAKAALPKPARQSCALYEGFYKRKFPSRKLAWRMDMGSAVVNVTFRTTSAPVDLVVTTMQMVVISCFATSTVVSFATIAKALGFAGDDGPVRAAQNSDVNDHILTLMHPDLGSQRVLQKKPSGRVLSPADRFRLNPRFNSHGLRMIPIRLRRGLAPRRVLDEADSQEFQKQIAVQRRNILDATIIQIMKHRKEMNYHQLITEVTSRVQKRFCPTPSSIKKRIEHLIEGEYMKRDANNRSLYHYLA